MKNIIVIMSDEHNSLYSSVYGHPFIKTPNMERMASMGTVFKNTYCPSPLCMPSRSSFISGRRVHEIQSYSNCNINLKHDYPSYGEELSRQGVHTAYIGKTDVYDEGKNLGFDEMILAGDRKLPGDINFIRKPLSIREDAELRASNFGPHDNPFKGDIKVTDEAVKWILNTSKFKKPWTLTVNLGKPHFPHYTTKELWDMYPQGENMPLYGNECESAKHPYAKDLRKHFQTDLFTEEQIKGLRRGYLACITFVDMQIGRILDALEEADILKDTNVIYTSDHGDMLGKFGMWWKCSLYEDSVKVPCIAMGPDFKKGEIIETPVDLLDVQATLFKSVNAKRPVNWIGKPLQEIEKNDNDRVVFSEYHGHGTRSGAYMIRKSKWKLIYYMEAPNQLFNVEDDPDELKNIYKIFPQKAKELEEELRKICVPEIENEKAHLFQDEQIKVLNKCYKNIDKE